MEPFQCFDKKMTQSDLCFDRISLAAVLGRDVGSKGGGRKPLSGDYWN